MLPPRLNTFRLKTNKAHQAHVLNQYSGVKLPAVVARRLYIYNSSVPSPLPKIVCDGHGHRTDLADLWDLLLIEIQKILSGYPRDRVCLMCRHVTLALTELLYTTAAWVGGQLRPSAPGAKGFLALLLLIESGDTTYCAESTHTQREKHTL